jgi:hypothetical protein
VADWRLAVYLDRNDSDVTGGGSAIVCNVSHAGGQPILFLPDRDKVPGIPSGWTPVAIDGDEYEANFVKVAVNVVRRPATTQNALPMLLRKWFGADAGQPGTGHRVQFVPGDRGLAMKPLTDHTNGLELWGEYPREQIPGLFGLEFKGPVWQQGFVVQGKQVFLLVTLQKRGMAESFQYEDRFPSPSEFHWQSQNRTTQASNHGQIISQHAVLGYTVHPWVREAASRDGRACPFRYCGELEFKKWEGERPITVWWGLKESVPPRYWRVLNIPA